MLALASDGTVTGTHTAEDRAVPGEELWWPPMAMSAGVAVTGRTALGLSSLLATMIVLATDCAVLPFHVFKRRPGVDGGSDPAPDHPVEQLIAVTPDGETTPLRWRQAFLAHALQYGNAFAEIQRKGRGTPVALHLMDPESTRTRRIGGKLWYENGDNLMPKENVLHISGIGFDGLMGYNLIHMLAQPIGLTLAAETSAAQFFANGAEPGGIIEFPKSLRTKDARDNVLNSWEAAHQGPANRHKTAILEEGGAWKPTMTDPDKQQLVETRRFQVLDLSRPWRVPPHKLGDYQHSHLANIEASNLDYLSTALIPWLEVEEQECNLKLFSESERKAGYYVQHDVNALLRGDITARSKFYQVLRDLGVLSPNDICKRENMNPLGPEGDIRLVPLNMVPLDQVGMVLPGTTMPTPGTGKPPAKPTTAPASPPAPSTSPVESAPGDGVDAPLTGEQIFSIQRVLSDVVQGDLPAGTAKALLKASLPSLDDAEIDAMLAPIEEFKATGPKSKP